MPASSSPVYRNPWGIANVIKSVEQVRFPYPLASCYRAFQNLSGTYSNVFFIHTLKEKWNFFPSLLFFFLIATKRSFFFFSLIRGFVRFPPRKEKHSIFSLHSFLVDWVRVWGGGFEGRWVDSRWISEIHLCTNAYFLREGNFLQLCSPATHSYSPSLVTHQRSGECIVLRLMPGERTAALFAKFHREPIRCKSFKDWNDISWSLDTVFNILEGRKIWQRPRYSVDSGETFLLDTYDYLLNASELESTLPVASVGMEGHNIMTE